MTTDIFYRNTMGRFRLLAIFASSLFLLW